ncbi:hypothetical protein [Schleiferilactobacillus shenzhenensis]|uniref:Uncharacterized protein n=1 Tax=Schleiferilactobacillus shenzhenensis LY-73 TaxID=1231336 RepID=U4TGE6_9LACO|nr:hypothetical protein [Schleiferilactobacillus shenzhenensis]ERL63821.1 hypothetical protein L248_2114 [Schleiferilactobacillus shenzhenensis LY-73]
MTEEQIFKVFAAKTRREKLDYLIDMTYKDPQTINLQSCVMTEDEITKWCVETAKEFTNFVSS